MPNPSTAVLAAIALLLLVALILLAVKRGRLRWLLTIRDRIAQFFAARADRSLDGLHEEWKRPLRDRDRND